MVCFKVFRDNIDEAKDSQQLFPFFKVISQCKGMECFVNSRSSIFFIGEKLHATVLHYATWNDGDSVELQSISEDMKTVEASYKIFLLVYTQGSNHGVSLQHLEDEIVLAYSEGKMYAFDLRTDESEKNRFFEQVMDYEDCASTLIGTHQEIDRLRGFLYFYNVEEYLKGIVEKKKHQRETTQIGKREGLAQVKEHGLEQKEEQIQSHGTSEKEKKRSQGIKQLKI